MHSKPRSHSSIFGVSWNPVNTALAIMIALLFLIFLLLFMTLTAQSAQGQNSAPLTAREAAKMPQYAARLAHRIGQQTTAAPAALARRAMRPGPLQGNEIYDNGPTNGNTDAWNIGFGYVVSESFVVPSGGATVTGMTFAAWLFPGDTLPSVTVGITSAENGGTTYFNQTLNIAQSGCVVNSFGFDVCNETTASFNVTLNSGTYWVNLQNGQASDGDSVYWDENSGPSSASATSIGTIPSESFTVLGEATSTCYPNCPAPCFNEQGQSGFQVIHDFTGGSDGAYPAGIFSDNSRNLYGASCTNELCGVYILFKLFQEGMSWIVKPLGGYQPWAGDIFGPSGALYGAAGWWTTGSVVNFQPTTNVCLTGSCSWTENSVYNFQGNPDGSNPTGAIVFDRNGNMYGTTTFGGGGSCPPSSGCGAVYELTPSPTGWTEKVIYGFPNGRGDQGAEPGALLVGIDGNLYGKTKGDGAYNDGTVYQLSPSLVGWSKTILYSFPYDQTLDDGPFTQDSAGNLYGTAIEAGSPFPHGIIFELSPSNGNWVFTIIRDNEDYGDLFNSMILGPDGNLYGTGGLGRYFGCGLASWCYAYIFKMTNVNGSWQFSTPIYFNGQLFQGYIGTYDNEGNLYGMTPTCGIYNDGTAWEFSP